MTRASTWQSKARAQIGSCRQMTAQAVMAGRARGQGPGRKQTREGHTAGKGGQKGGQVPGAPRLLCASLFLLFFSFLNLVTRRNFPLRLRLERSSITFCGGRGETLRIRPQLIKARVTALELRGADGGLGEDALSRVYLFWCSSLISVLYLLFVFNAFESGFTVSTVYFHLLFFHFRTCISHVIKKLCKYY